MSKQECTIGQSDKISKEMNDEFQTIENVIMQVFEMLHEYDQLIKIVEKESEKLKQI